MRSTQRCVTLFFFFSSRRRHTRYWRDWSSDVCSSDLDRFLGPWTAPTSSPVLVVGNYFDPATPHHGAVAASQLLPGSRLLSYAGRGHAAYLTAGNFCVDSQVTRYLLTGDVPAAGTVCEPAGSPFGPTPAATPEDTPTRAAVNAGAVPEAVRRALDRKRVV